MRKNRSDSDRTDDLLINLLTQNSRTPITSLAQKLTLSESAVRRRIQNMVASGRIKKFTLEVDEKEVSRAITWVSVSPSIPTRQVSDKVRGVAGVEAVYETAGQFDIAALIKGADIAEVNKTVEGIRRVEGVITTNTSMVLRSMR